jgi:hypothetical protein
VNTFGDTSFSFYAYALLLFSFILLLIPSISIFFPPLQYDVPRRMTSVGSNVRDAACYTYWSCARAYDPLVLKPYVQILSESIIVSSLFDREVNCRRAASAAFQEFVGRQGATVSLDHIQSLHRLQRVCERENVLQHTNPFSFSKEFPKWH